MIGQRSYFCCHSMMRLIGLQRVSLEKEHLLQINNIFSPAIIHQLHRSPFSSGDLPVFQNRFSFVDCLFVSIHTFLVKFWQNFTGNKDRNTVVTHWFPMITAQHLRVLPMKWSGLTNCMRIELYGCRNGKYTSKQRATTREQSCSASQPDLKTYW